MAPVDAGTEASRRMHEYLMAKQRKQEEYWLRKYGKILQPGPPSLGKMPSSSRLPPLSGGGSGTSLPDSERSSAGGAGGNLSRDPSAASGLLPPIPGAQPSQPSAGFLPHHRHQPKGHAPIFHANEPVKDFFGRNARQQRSSAFATGGLRDEYGNMLPPSHRPAEPYRNGYPAQLPPLGGEYSYGTQTPTEATERAASAPGSWRGQQDSTQQAPQQEPSSTYSHGHQYGQPSPQALQRQYQHQQRAAQVLGRLPPLQHEPSGPRGGALRGVSSGGGSSHTPGKPLRNLEMELSVIRAIKAREDVLERLRIAGGKLDSGFGGRAPVVLSPVDPLVRLFYRLVGTLRQRTLDVVESIAAWRRKVSPSEPFIYYGVDYLAAIGPDVGFLDELPFLRTRLTFTKAANDPFLAEVTPDGIPIEEATTCDLRRGGQRFSSDALRIRMARKVLAQYCGRPLVPSAATADAAAVVAVAGPDGRSIADIPSGQLFAELSQPRSVHSYAHSPLEEGSDLEKDRTDGDAQEAEADVVEKEMEDPGLDQRMRAVTPPMAPTPAQAGLLPSLVRAITPPPVTAAMTAATAAAPSPRPQMEVSGDGEDEQEDEQEEEAREREREREAEQYFSGEEEDEQPDGENRRAFAADESQASGGEEERDQEPQQEEWQQGEPEIYGSQEQQQQEALEADGEDAVDAADAEARPEAKPHAEERPLPQQTEEEDLLVFEDDNDYIDFALGAIIQSLEPPYADAIEAGTFTVAGWEIDQQLEEVVCGIASPLRQARASLAVSPPPQPPPLLMPPSPAYDADEDGTTLAPATAAKTDAAGGAPPTTSRASGRIPFPPMDLKPPSRDGTSSRPASRGSRIPAPPSASRLSSSAVESDVNKQPEKSVLRLHLRPNSRGVDLGLSMDDEAPAHDDRSLPPSDGASTSSPPRPPVRVHLRPNSREQIIMGLSMDLEDFDAAGGGGGGGGALPVISEDRSAYFGNTDTEGNDGNDEEPTDGVTSGDDAGAGLPYDDGDGSDSLLQRPLVRVHLRPNSREVNMGLSIDDEGPGLGTFPSANMRYGVTSVAGSVSPLPLPPPPPPAAADAMLQAESPAGVSAMPASPPLDGMPLPLQGPLSARSNRASIRSARRSSGSRPTSASARDSMASWGDGADE